MEEREKLAKKHFAQLKVDLSKKYIQSNVGKNLDSFRTMCEPYLGPAQYMGLDFLKICNNLEGCGEMSYKNIGLLKEFVKELPINSQQMVELVEKAEVEIKNILTVTNKDGNNPPPDSGQSPAAASAPAHAPAPAIASNVTDFGEEFHQRESHTLSYQDGEILFSRHLKRSIGLVYDEMENSYGTGFRVGEDFVMTAYHVLRDSIDNLKKLLVSLLREPDSTDKPLQELGIDERYLQSSVESYLSPVSKAMRFKSLSCHLIPKYREKIETKWRTDTGIKFDLGTKEEVKFYFDLDITFADEENDILILKLRVDGGSKRKPDAIHLDQFEVNSNVHLIGYLPSTTPARSLTINSNCKVYINERQLAEDIDKAQKWWKQNLPSADLDPCLYEQGKTETRHGRVILHASKEFEHRSSGSPGFAIDNYTSNRLKVQLMYLAGYPSHYYESHKRFEPKPEYCFESAISMKRIGTILSLAGQEELKSNIFR